MMASTAAEQPGLTWQNWLNLISMVADLAVGGIAAAMGRFITNQGRPYPGLVEPATYTFAIWGLVYLLTVTFAVAQMLPAYRQNEITQTVAP